MKCCFKKNRKYVFVFVFCILVILYSFLGNLGLLDMIGRAISEPDYLTNYFYNSDLGIINGSPSFFNFLTHAISHSYVQFESSLIFGTSFFQLIIPVFALVSGVSFFHYYNSIYMLEVGRVCNHRVLILQKIVQESCKLGLSIFFAYMIYLLFLNTIADPKLIQANGVTRYFLSDIIGNNLYHDNMFFYFTIEGFVRFFIMPFTYAFFAQTCVLYFQSIKSVIAAPILYYYVLATIGYAIALVNQDISIYTNPTSIMSSGDYSGFNSLLMIAINLIPLYIGIGLVFRRTSNGEI